MNSPDPKRDPRVPAHTDPMSVYQCSQSKYKQYLQMKSAQTNWTEILQLSQCLIDSLMTTLDKQEQNQRNMMEMDCKLSKSIGIPGVSCLSV